MEAQNSLYSRPGEESDNSPRASELGEAEEAFGGWKDLAKEHIIAAVRGGG